MKAARDLLCGTWNRGDQLRARSPTVVRSAGDQAVAEDGTPGRLLQLRRGQAAARSIDSWAAFRRRLAQQVKRGSRVPVAHLGRKELPDTPVAYEIYLLGSRAGLQSNAR